MADSKKIKKALADFALSLPGAVEEFPWGDRVAKVNKKIFVFLGHTDDADPHVHLTVKLPDSGVAALELPNAEPTGYGLGKAGWVSLHFEPDECPPAEYLTRWIEESYRSIAPKRMSAQLDGPGAQAGAKKAAAPKPTTKKAAAPRPTTKKAAAPRPTAKKAAAKKPPAKKAAAKKPATTKTAAKKPAARKAAK